MGDREVVEGGRSESGYGASIEGWSERMRKVYFQKVFWAFSVFGDGGEGRDDINVRFSVGFFSFCG